jgi:hypothetical protein
MIVPAPVEPTPLSRGFSRLGEPENGIQIGDRETERAYVELREPDSDGGEFLVTAIFCYRSNAIYSKRELEQDLARKARHMLQRASIDLDGR